MASCEEERYVELTSSEVHEVKGGTTRDDIYHKLWLFVDEICSLDKKSSNSGHHWPGCCSHAGATRRGF